MSETEVEKPEWLTGDYRLFIQIEPPLKGGQHAGIRPYKLYAKIKDTHGNEVISSMIYSKGHYKSRLILFDMLEYAFLSSRFY